MSAPRLSRPGRPPPRASGRLPYWLKLAITAIALGGMTAAFVLVVLPQRFVLQTGLTSSGVSFPARAAPSQPDGMVMTEPSPRPVPPARAPEPDRVRLAEKPPVPGPAEVLWDRVRPLMDGGRPEEALPLLAEYLEAYPDHHGVRMEYGVALARTGRSDEAEAAFREVAEAAGNQRVRLELAHVLRERGDLAGAVALYRELADGEPDDVVIRIVLARTLAAAGRHDEAEETYRRVLEQEPGRADVLLELASLLWTADRAEEALELAASVPAGAPEHAEAETLVALLEGVLTAEEEAVDAPELSRPARARLAMERDGPSAAYRMYTEDLAQRPGDAEALLEWADLFQYVLEDMRAARDAVERRARILSPTGEERLRLARLYAWTGEERQARAELEELLEFDRENAEAWALLGDLRRWEGSRFASFEAYQRALAIEPGEEQARAGMEELREATQEAIFRGHDPGFGPQLDYFRDSEGFRHMSLTGRAALLVREHDGLAVRSGYRRLEGFLSGGAPGTDEGMFGELELSRWWREGTVRAAVFAGAESLGELGAEPVFGGAIEASELGRWTLEGSYRHGRAYPAVSTLESVDMAIQADQASVGLHLRLPPDWNVSGSGELASFRGGGTDNLRLAGGVSATRRLSPALRIGAATRVLGFTDAAPTPSARRAYWDPELFWSLEAPVELSVPRSRGWTAWARLAPGIALARERDVFGSDWVPQLSGSGGIRYLGDRTTLDADLFHARGREGEYRSLGLSLRLTVRR